MEVSVKPHYEDLGNPYSIRPSYPKYDIEGCVNSLYLDMEITNHSTNMPQRIIGCHAELRKRRVLFWKRTLITIPVTRQSPNKYDDFVPINDIFLEPMGKPNRCLIQIDGEFPELRLPHKSELVLVFKMVGPMRSYVYKLEDVIHDHKKWIAELDKEFSS